jgi:hypothetical protein
MWLGAVACVDLLINQNYSTIDRFISDPASPGAAAQVRETGPASARFILRRNASEENAWVLNKWEWMQIALALALLLLVMVGERPPVLALFVIPTMLIIVLLQLSLVTPHIATLGREVDEIPASELLSSAAASRLQAFDGTFWGGEALKILCGIVLLWKLMYRREHSRSSDRESVAGTTEAREGAAKSEGRVRRRRTSHSQGSRGV